MRRVTLFVPVRCRALHAGNRRPASTGHADCRAHRRAPAHRRVRAVLLGRGARARADGDSRVRRGRPLLRVGRERRRLGGDVVRSRHHGERRHPLPALRTARAGGRAEPRLPRGGWQAALVENVRDSFASSVLAALPVEADEGGRVLVDATPLFMRDAADVEGRLRAAQPGRVPLRCRPQRLLPAADEGVPGQHRDRDHRDVRGRQAGAARDQRHAGWAVVHDADPPLVPAGARRLHAAAGRSAHRRQRASNFRDYAQPFNENTEVEWVTRWRLEKRIPARR